CLPPQPPERPLERLDVNVVQQRREPDLARPFGRITHSSKIGWQGSPAPCPVLRFLARVPHQSGPSLRPTRFLRRHRRYYSPIRHPATHKEWPSRLQSQLARLISRMTSRIPVGTIGRPPPKRDFQRQNARSP